jgi:cation diffusion facilitator CzcD-associated flavoprotein CzcO
LLYWFLELRFAAIFRNQAMRERAERRVRQHIHETIPDPALRKAVTPDYAMGCKRILLSSDYYPALTLPQVDVETSGITEVRENSVVTGDGREHEVDAIIYGTGFHVTDGFEHLAIVGRDGRKLQDVWQDGTEAYLGITVSGFPNLFFLLGPNTGLGHHSVVFMIECQINYVLQVLRRARHENIGQVDVRQDAQETFNRSLQSELAEGVWSRGGCHSWYLDENGVNRTLWPGFTYEYWQRTRNVEWADYEIEYARDTR